jgi:general nucleoside transport system permease protein
VLGCCCKGAFGSPRGFSYTLYYATTFVFTGLAVAVAFHGGLFNIGGEGQAVLGGLGTALVALAWGRSLPAWLLLPLMACWRRALRHGLGRGAGLRCRPRGSHVVITTIMFNFIARRCWSGCWSTTSSRAGNMAPESAPFGPAAHCPACTRHWAGRHRGRPRR